MNNNVQPVGKRLVPLQTHSLKSKSTYATEIKKLRGILSKERTNSFEDGDLDELFEESLDSLKTPQSYINLIVKFETALNAYHK
jgi:hypothetical protein